jgi:hypothetical protein
VCGSRLAPGGKPLGKQHFYFQQKFRGRSFALANGVASFACNLSPSVATSLFALWQKCGASAIISQRDYFS